jgi:ribosomal protein L30E
MNLAVVGSRVYHDRTVVYYFLAEYLKVYGDELVIVSGGCPQGPDNFAEDFASLHNIPTKIYRANWNEFGKAAGFIRNTTIVDNCDEVIAFWDRKSNGTKDTITKAEKQNKEVIIVDDQLTLTQKCIKLLMLT